MHNTLPYIMEAGDRKLKETYVGDDLNLPKYKQVSEAVLRRQHKKLLDVTKEWVEIGLICQEDAAIVVPEEAEAGCLHMNPKGYKTPDPVTNLQPKRKVVSGHGSNTEGLKQYPQPHTQHHH